LFIGNLFEYNLGTNIDLLAVFPEKANVRGSGRSNTVVCSIIIIFLDRK
jgi:hypothetical protein